jgi:hypothetical protein
MKEPNLPLTFDTQGMELAQPFKGSFIARGLLLCIEPGPLALTAGGQKLSVHQLR